MRLKRNFTRKTGLRDAKLIIIATEGEKTEKAYFNGIAFSAKYRNSKVHVEILERIGTDSDPKTCFQSLNKFKREYNLNINDELWLICDVDRWGQKKLSEVIQLCKQKGYRSAISNPCFEIWLLLHSTKVSEYSKEATEGLTEGCANVVDELKKILGSYNKANLEITQFINGVEHAIEQARVLDKPGEAWPNLIGSKVFYLMESILGIEQGI